ncbi:MAG: response regulator [Rickettsiales bacterium]
MIGSFPEPFTLVMIEDDEGHATLIMKNLKRAGIGNRVVHLQDGARAVDYFFGKANGHINHEKTLVLLDLNLPEVDGYEILSKLKGDARTRTIPVIVLTTTDNPKEIDRCYELGCNVYITKPVEYDNFTDAIQKLGLMLAVVKVPHLTT